MLLLLEFITLQIIITIFNFNFFVNEFYLIVEDIIIFAIAFIIIIKLVIIRILIWIFFNLDIISVAFRHYRWANIAKMSLIIWLTAYTLSLFSHFFNTSFALWDTLISNSDMSSNDRWILAQFSYDKLLLYHLNFFVESLQMNVI